MPWTRADIAGKPADVFEPAAPSPHGHVVLFLHGHGLITLAGNAVWSAELERHGLRCVCPHGGPSWWLDVVCEEFDPHVTPLRFLRENVTAFVEGRWGTKPPGIGLTGVSMGGQGALQLAYRYAREFPVVAALSPAIDFHNLYGQGLPLDAMFPTREAARQQTAVLQIHPLNWPRHQLIACDPADAEWFESADRLAMKLSSSGVPFESDLTTTRGGHSWDYFNHMAPKAVAFLAERLEKERLRV